MEETIVKGDLPEVLNVKTVKKKVSTPPGVLLYYEDIKPLLENCDDEKIATIFKLVFISYCEMTDQTDNKIYASRMDIEKLTGLEQAFLQIILDKVERDKKKYDEKVESQREKGKKSHSKDGLSQSQPRITVTRNLYVYSGAKKPRARRKKDKVTGK